MFPRRRALAPRKLAAVAPSVTAKPSTPAAPVNATAPATSTPAAQALAASPAPMKEYRAMNPNQTAARTVETLGEKDTQPLFFRLTIGAGALAAGRKIPIFHKSRNTDPDLTNLEQANQMPNTSSFKVAGIEIRALPGCSTQALKNFLTHTRHLLSVGAKGFEKVNQPSVMFPSLCGTGAGADFSTHDAKGLYTFNRGEEVNLLPSQTFDSRFEVDSQGCVIPADETLDIVISYKGQKTSSLAL